MHFVAAEAITGPEVLNPLLNRLLLRLQPIKLRFTLTERAQVAGNESAQRRAFLGSANPGAPENILGDGYGHILHRITVSQPYWCAIAPGDRIGKVPGHFAPDAEIGSIKHHV